MRNVVEALIDKSGDLETLTLFRQAITGSIWESLYDQMAGFEGTVEQMNDPNRIWPVLRQVVGDLDRALAGVNSAWHAQQAAPQGSTS